MGKTAFRYVWQLDNKTHNFLLRRIQHVWHMWMLRMQTLQTLPLRRGVFYDFFVNYFNHMPLSLRNIAWNAVCCKHRIEKQYLLVRLWPRNTEIAKSTMRFLVFLGRFPILSTLPSRRRVFKSPRGRHLYISSPGAQFF